VGIGSFFARLQQEDAEKAWSEALDRVAQLAVRAISVHLFKTKPDAVSETKSLESAAQQWRSALRAALLQGLSKALKKALGPPPPRLLRRPKPADSAAVDSEGAAEPRAAAAGSAGHSYHLHFGDWLCGRRADQSGECANMQLERRCYLWAKGHSDHPKQGCHSSLVIDAYARHYATRSASERALPAPRGACATAAGFYFLLEKPLLAADAPCCPMCRRPLALGEVQTAPRWRCGGCGFWQLHAPSAFELCPVFAWRQARKAQQPPLRLQQLAVALLTALHLGSDLCALQLLSLQLKGKKASAAAGKSRRGAPMAGKSKAAVGAIVTAFTEDSARGREAKRGRHGAPPLHDDLFACDAGKDNNPDLRLFLRAGSTMQRRPGEAQLTRLEQALRRHLEQTRLAKAEGDGSLLMRGARLLRFDAADVLRVLLETRCLVHDEAARQRDAELATCCPLLSYVGCGPVVTLLCSGHELVRPVKWRRSSLLARWGAGGGSGGAPSLGELAGLHWTWADVESTGLSWDLLVFAGFVSYAVADEHAVLLDGQEFGRLPDGHGDGLTFGLFDELEAATRMLQLEDAATWPAGHAVRAGYSASLALGAHKSEALRHSKGHVSGGRAIGHDPHKVNVRSLVATAPDNHYGSTLKLVAVLRDYFSWMQEDSLPESADAFRHVVLKHQSVVLHRKGPRQAGPPEEAASLASLSLSPLPPTPHSTSPTLVRRWPPRRWSSGCSVTSSNTRGACRRTWRPAWTPRRASRGDFRSSSAGGRRSASCWATTTSGSCCTLRPSTCGSWGSTCASWSAAAAMSSGRCSWSRQKRGRSTASSTRSSSPCFWRTGSPAAGAASPAWSPAAASPAARPARTSSAPG